jgi:bacillithiol biosynthesis cysteine-adding enzyme BshC
MVWLTKHDPFRPTLSGELPVKAQCLPFSQIPHTTRLFTDFLSASPKVQPFYPRSPQFAQWVQDETQRVRYDAARRERVAAILERQNKLWGASAKTLENIARLRQGAFAVVTGQQVGLFGGPTFSIYKALHALKLADEATAAGVDCVPVFWLATQDHDVAEIRSTSLPGPEGLQKFVVPTEGTPDAPVGNISFGAEIEPVVSEATALLGENEVAAFLRESYRPGETYGSAYARLFTRLFAEWGLILMDASDAEMTAVASPIFQMALDHTKELTAALLTRNQELEAAGYHAQVKVTQSSTLLFTLQNGARTPIHQNGQDFLAGEEKISAADLRQRIAVSPQNFSANVLLRPIVQDHLLPTLSYIGGAAEVAYFAQVAVVYQYLLGRVTPILPRFSATIVEPKPQTLLERYGLSLPDLFHGPDPLRQKLATQVLPADLQSAFDHAEKSLTESLAGVKSALERLDKTLVEAAGNAEGKIRHQLEQIRAKAARAELQKSEVAGRHADLLSSALFPNKTLQEREVAGIYFLSKYGLGLLKDLYENIHTECVDHQVVTI